MTLAATATPVADRAANTTRRGKNGAGAATVPPANGAAGFRCTLCGHSHDEPLLAGVVDYLSGEAFDIVQCDRCLLAVTHPMPAPESLADYYPPRYRTDRQKLTGGRRVKLRAAAVEKQFPKGFRGRLLDLGCGTGAFAMEMRRRGWDVAVTELNDDVLDAMRAGGIEAKRPDEALREGFAKPFDAITAWHVLEHVPDPLALAKFSRRHLAANGIFQATVPNFESRQAERFGKHWLHLDVPRHLYHFTPDTLAKLLLRADFQIAGSSMFAFEYDVFGVIQSALNVVCRKPNVLFEKITNNRGPASSFSPRDIAMSYAAAPFLAAYALPQCVLAATVGNGATLTVTSRLG